MRKTAENRLTELKRRLLEINDLNSAGSVLYWDQQTHMPEGGANARARQMATLSRLTHEKSTDPELGNLLDSLESELGKLSENDAALVRVCRRDFEKDTKVPAEFTARLSEHSSHSYVAWTRAYAENDFALVVPHLRRMVDLGREFAEFFAPFAHIADPLIDYADEGMTVSETQRLFGQLRSHLLALVDAVTEKPSESLISLKGTFDRERQLELLKAIVQQLGYDLDRGQIDETVHAFCIRFASGDVRIATHINIDDFTSGFFGTVHEAGHALYEQGVASAFDGTPLGYAASAGIHESQSRLWENMVGRSLPFWRHWFPSLQKTFPQFFDNISVEDFYRMINTVERSLIRTKSDEVTYNLHIMMRFDLELDLLEGRIDVEDLPDAWDSRMSEYLGIVPETNREGCLQDVHWYAGPVGGAFQSYTIGNILAAQVYEAAQRAITDLPVQIEEGNFKPLREWLQTNLHQHGRKYVPNDLITRATGEPLRVEPYIQYLRNKYGELYGLSTAQ